MSDDRAGKKHDEYWGICEAVVTNDHKFSKKEVDFAQSMLERLNDYREQTFVSIAQRNWLNDLEQKCRDLKL